MIRLYALLCLLVSGAAGAALPSALPGGESLPSLAPMLERVTPAVVNIATYTTVQVRNPLLEDPFFRRFFNVPEQERFRRTQSAGSGVVVDARRGYIVTNNHVVERADEINVTLSDGRTLKAEMVGTDPRVDLAVLKVQPDALVEIGFANSAQARVGDFVVAIGNPFGLNQTVTSGIISALGRSGLGIEGYEDFIQTDASINPGNSGGALVDLGGRLIGINTAILAPAGGNVGIGFAIPANMVRAIMGELIAHGEVRRGFLGLAVQGLNPDLAEAFGVENRDGVVVVEIQPDGAAARAGLRPGDIIVRVDDQPIRRVTEFDGQAALMFVGERVAIEVLRDGQPRTLTLEIVDEPLEKVPGERLDRRLLGTTLQNFRNEADAADSAGVLVSEVGEDTLAWQFGLRPGDIVVACNRRGVRNLDDMQASVERSGDQLLLRVYRAGQYGYIVIR
jgi:serine protease Do/serine protease DegQ